ncbi:MAG: GNAT family N-acetyltransferase [Bacteroidales bacterium]|nr:GNAT family N-acetyltransferase [Bacteroidales bacterium]
MVKHGDNIRLAGAEDLATVGRLLEHVLAVHHSGRPDLFRANGKKYTDDQLLDIFANPDTPVWVYERGGAVVAYAFCAMKAADAENLEAVKTLYLDDFCVDPSCQGQGIGRALFEYVRDWAANLGFHNLTLHVWECNPDARAFYDSLGLKPQYTSMEIIL